MFAWVFALQGDLGVPIAANLQFECSVFKAREDYDGALDYLQKPHRLCLCNYRKERLAAAQNEKPVRTKAT